MLNATCAALSSPPLLVFLYLAPYSSISRNLLQSVPHSSSPSPVFFNLVLYSPILLSLPQSSPVSPTDPASWTQLCGPNFVDPAPWIQLRGPNFVDSNCNRATGHKTSAGNKTAQKNALRKNHPLANSNIHKLHHHWNFDLQMAECYEPGT